MKRPQRLLSLPEFARRLRIFYSLAYSAWISGDLVPDFVSNKQALFDERNLSEKVKGLRSRLTAEDYDELLKRIRPLDASGERERETKGEVINSTLRTKAVTVTTIKPGQSKAFMLAPLPDESSVELP